MRSIILGLEMLVLCLDLVHRLPKLLRMIRILTPLALSSRLLTHWCSPIISALILIAPTRRAARESGCFVSLLLVSRHLLESPAHSRNSIGRLAGTDILRRGEPGPWSSSPALTHEPDFGQPMSPRPAGVLCRHTAHRRACGTAVSD